MLSFPSSESLGGDRCPPAGPLPSLLVDVILPHRLLPSATPRFLLLDCPGSNSPDQSPRPTVCLPCRREGLARLFLYNGTQICSKPNTDLIYFSLQVEMLVEGLW